MFRLKLYSGTPLALIAPGLLALWPISMATRKSLAPTSLPRAPPQNTNLLDNRSIQNTSYRHFPFLLQDSIYLGLADLPCFSPASDCLFNILHLLAPRVRDCLKHRKTNPLLPVQVPTLPHPGNNPSLLGLSTGHHLLPQIIRTNIDNII